MSGLEVNKILASIILAILVVTVIGHLGDIIVDVEHHEMEETAYKIDVPETGEIVPGAAPKVEVIEPISLLLASASLENGQKLFKKCSACHSIKKGGRNNIGPALYNVLGRNMGALEDYKYSKALIAFGKDWTFQEMNSFLIKPASYIKGTKMAFAGLKKEKDRASVILYMNANADSPLQLP
jgi:cytochrome c